MTKEDIISQGYLEAYLTGDLSEQDKSRVEHLLHDADVAREYRTVQEKLETMAHHAAIAPADEVRLKLLMRIIQRGSSKVRMIYYLAASFSLAVLSTVAAFYFYSKYAAANDQLAVLEQQNTEMAHTIQQVNQQITNVQGDLRLLMNPAYARVVMNSVVEGNRQQAVIYFNPAEQKVYINSLTLPELPENMQYQLWALIDGQPVDAGTFFVQRDNFQQMKPFEKVDAFAVTIEPKGGSASPTLEKMQVYGEV